MSHVLITYVVRYPKSEWSRADAWHHLKGQQIPGCPDRFLELPPRAGMYTNGFLKAHEADCWAWIYRGAPRSVHWKIEQTKAAR